MAEKMDLSLQKMHPGSSIRKLIAESQASGTERPFNRRPGVPLTLRECIKWIKEGDYEDYIENNLISSVSRYPHSALLKFMQSIPSQISRIKKERRERDGKSTQQFKEEKVREEEGVEAIKPEEGDLPKSTDAPSWQ